MLDPKLLRSDIENTAKKLSRRGINIDVAAISALEEPVFSPAPVGEDAVKMWDAMVSAGRVPGFFEFKRSRNVGPIFGERPQV
jgi:hypothetical protein